jgi:hypothetical protein
VLEEDAVVDLVVDLELDPVPVVDEVWEVDGLLARDLGCFVECLSVNDITITAPSAITATK